MVDTKVEKPKTAPNTGKSSTANNKTSPSTPSNNSEPRGTTARHRKRHFVIPKDPLSDTESGDEEYMDKRGKEAIETSPEYWFIQKLIKYLRIGNQTATIIAISALRDTDLTLEQNQVAVRDLGGLDIFVNLLETKDSRCVKAALLVLLDLSNNVSIRSTLCEMNLMEPLVRLLDDPSNDVKCKAAYAIANCAKNVKSRRMVRQYDGIRKLIKLLNSDNDNFIRGAASALWTCSKSERNKKEMSDANVIDIVKEHMELKEEVLVPVVGLLQECAKNPDYRDQIRNSLIIPSIITHVKKSSNILLLTHAVSCIFECANDPQSRSLVRESSGLVPIASLIDKYQQMSKETKEVVNGKLTDAGKQLRNYLASVTGAIWKLCLDPDNIIPFLQLGIVKKLVSIMDLQPPSDLILVHTVGALGAFAQTQPGRLALREGQAIKPLIQLLTRSDPYLLENAAKAVGACAEDNDCMIIIDKNDGVRLLWSLLKSQYPQVQTSAAWAIRPCIEHARDAGELVRSFVGGLELIVSLLKSNNAHVLAGVCAALSKIAKDNENLGVMTDHGIVVMLAKLTSTKNDHLRKPLAEAIAQCCAWGRNRLQFGQADAVGPLVKFLKSSDPQVHVNTALALQQLSLEPQNCVAMHEYGAVPLLLDMVGSSNEVLQEAAAATIGNIRKIALKGEMKTTM